jgi:molybdopterin synthase sulfur carrier subunit
MPDPAPGSVSSVGTVTVRYWAAARAAAGVEQDVLALPDGATLADALAEVRSIHADRPRLADIVKICSVLVGERPVGAADPAQVRLRAGDVVELLPPFAGG